MNTETDIRPQSLGDSLIEQLDVAEAAPKPKGRKAAAPKVPKEPKVKAPKKLTKKAQAALDLANAIPMPQPPRGQTRPTIAQLRASIAQAQADGVAMDDMVLRLSTRDEAMLKRSPEVATNEIAFSAGQMRFLGVRVQTGPVSVSWLDTKTADVGA